MPVERSGPRGVLWIALAASLAHFASFDVFSQPIVTDVRYFLYYSWQVAEGAVPHLDFFENKPQLPVFAGALFYRLGELAGADPLIAIRLGFLAIASAGGVLSFCVFRRLAGRDPVVGFLGLLAYCSFGLIGLLPAVGTISKLMMAVLASGMALLVQDRRWFWAGVVGALAFLDWQIGAVVWLAAAISAGLFAEPRRPALLAVTAGGAVGIAPALLYYGAHGALRAAFEQVIVSTFFRGSAALETGGLGERIARIGELVAAACPQQQWLFYASFLGIGACAYWLSSRAAPDRRRLLVPLCIHHGTLLGFSLVDFQGYGDLYALLHTCAFLLGTAWALLYSEGSLRVVRHFGEKRRGAFAAGLLVVAFLAARPAWLRPQLALAAPGIAAEASLADQREVATAVSQRVSGGTFVAMDSSELLFLMRNRNPLPNIYWGRAVRAYYRESESESATQTIARLLRSVDPDVFVEPRRVRERGDSLLPGYAPLQITSKNGSYAVSLRVR